VRHLKVVVKNLLPPYLTRFARYCRFIVRSWAHADEQIGFKYGFKDYEASVNFVNSIGFGGYQEEEFIERLTSAARNVRDGDSPYERDSVVFDSPQYSWPLVAALLTSINHKNVISVLDYGGGLGTTYWQNRSFLVSKGARISWRILEQEALVRIGREEFSSEELEFLYGLDEVKDTPDIVIFGSSLCYLPTPYDVMKRILKLGPKFIVLDRTPFVTGDCDLFAVQFVPASIYRAALPIISLSEEKFKRFMETEYDLVGQWICDMQPDPNSTSMGSFWRKRVK
jgi:putative methyltransferase (TIGR04325 family)